MAVIRKMISCQSPVPDMKWLLNRISHSRGVVLRLGHFDKVTLRLLDEGLGGEEPQG